MDMGAKLRWEKARLGDAKVRLNLTN